ncbi:MAG TPA: zinc ribbon domain-containing protein [Patescibacteria group bacterium]|nr:zinc ribbon domain-containing protein [Patescibacteria group bacterium]
MYCTSCGTPVPDDARFCCGCGKPVAGVAAAIADAARARLARHRPVLAVLWAVYSLLRIMAGGAILFAGSAMGMPGFFIHGYRPWGTSFGWPFSGFMLHGLIAGAGVGMLGLGILGLAAGWGLWHQRAWGRILALILGVFALFRIPLGTALGIYTLWVLLPRAAAAEYARPV